MSRPDRNEKHHLHIELTAQQYQLLCRQAQKCGLTKRAFLVRLIEGRPVKARPAQEIKDLRTEIHHIGNNINQIARSVNAGIARPEDARRGLYLLDQVYDWGWHVMQEEGLPIDSLGEMWHGYREKDERIMYQPYYRTTEIGHTED